MSFSLGHRLVSDPFELEMNWKQKSVIGRHCEIPSRMRNDFPRRKTENP
jgi:hypothetical protein